MIAEETIRELTPEESDQFQKDLLDYARRRAGREVVLDPEAAQGRFQAIITGMGDGRAFYAIRFADAEYLLPAWEISKTLSQATEGEQADFARIISTTYRRLKDANKLIPQGWLACMNCGTRFKPQRSTRRFCSRRCQDAYGARERRKSKAAA